MWNNQIMYPISVYSSLHADLLGTLALTNETMAPVRQNFWTISKNKILTLSLSRHKWLCRETLDVLLT